MANPGYVRSTDGNDSDNGSTWALANATLAGAASDAVAGDRIWLSDNHAESGSSISVALPGTLVSPNQVLCGDDAAEPPTSLATGGWLSATTTTLSISGSAYIYGLRLQAQTNITMNGGSSAARQHIVNCEFVTLGTGSTGGFNFGSTSNIDNSTRVENCTFKWAGASNLGRVNGRTRIIGCSTAGGSSTPNNLFTTPGDRTASILSVEDCDFSALGTGFNIFATSAATGVVDWQIRDCKLPSGWSGSLCSGTIPGAGQRFSMFNCDAGDTNFTVWIKDYCGDLTHETTIVRSGGASDGTTPIAWKIVTTANAEYPLLPFSTPEIVRWQEAVGSAITVTVEVVNDGVTLTDAECWLEVQYLGTNGFPLGVLTSDAKATVLASAANQTSSSETWATTGLSSPVKQALSVTFTPREKGFLRATVHVARASTTVYVDPKLSVT